MSDLDVITIGRASVDLYGGQVGGRLEDMRSFNKYVGGSPANMAVGTARLGLKSALITRVGDEHMGRFIREQLISEGVDTTGIRTDPERLTALVLLGIRDREQFPLIFYRRDCADMALCEDDIDPAFIARARCVTVTGTHLSNPRTESAVLKALTIARKNGQRTALDIDYRPNLWGLAGHGDGEARFIESAAVTAKVQSTLHLFDLIVGTQEEFHLAGGSTDTMAALRAVRAKTDAILVLKRGPMGADAFIAGIPDDSGSGPADGGGGVLTGPGFPVEVFNVLGAGDGFMSGLLKGWLRGAPWATALAFANACGALAVSRHGCAPAYPSREELDYFLKHGSKYRALRKDKTLEHIHRATNRKGKWPCLKVFAFDHRAEMQDMAADAGIAPEDAAAKIRAFKQLCLQAALNVQAGQPGFGILCDAGLGEDALFKAAGQGLWIGRPVEKPAARRPEPGLSEQDHKDHSGDGPALQACGLQAWDLKEWPSEHTVKLRVFYHHDDPEALKKQQETPALRLAEAAHRQGLEFLLELMPSKAGAVDDETTARAIRRFYEAGVFPDWWKLEPLKTDAAWQATCTAVSDCDPWCRGIVVSGLDAPQAELADAFRVAAKHGLVKGFAVGRTLFSASAKAWLRGGTDDATAVAQMTVAYQDLCRLWSEAKAR